MQRRKNSWKISLTACALFSSILWIAIIFVMSRDSSWWIYYFGLFFPVFHFSTFSLSFSLSHSLTLSLFSLFSPFSLKQSYLWWNVMFSYWIAKSILDMALWNCWVFHFLEMQPMFVTLSIFKDSVLSSHALWRWSVLMILCWVFGFMFYCSLFCGESLTKYVSIFHSLLDYEFGIRYCMIVLLFAPFLIRVVSSFSWQSSTSRKEKAREQEGMILVFPRFPSLFFFVCESKSTVNVFDYVYVPCLENFHPM